MKRFATFAALLAFLALATTAFAAGGLSGKYKEKISGDSADGGQLNGTWVIALSSGAYTAKDSGHQVEKGTYKVTGRKVTFRATTAVDNCTTAGKYKFKLTGRKLKFTLLSDPSGACAGRRAVLTHGSFTKETGSGGGLIGGY
jgi:hypothetical protein